MDTEPDPQNGNYVPLPQASLVDTRSGIGLPEAPITGGPTSHVEAEGAVGIPSTGVAAIAVLLTTVNSTSSSEIKMWPTGATEPLAAASVTNPGDIRQNSAYVALSSDGHVSIAIDHDATDLIVHVTGYFSKTDMTAGFNPVAQKRVADTNNGTGVPHAAIAAGASVTFSVASAGVPSSATALALNFTTTSTGNGSLNAGPSDGGSNTFVGLGFAGGSDPWADTAFVQVSATQQIKVTNSSSNAINLTVDIFGYFAGDDDGGGFTPLQSQVYDSANSNPANLAANQTAYIKLLGAGGVPARLVGSVSVELTTTGEADAGSVRAWDPDNAEPTGTDSVLDFQGDDTVTDSAILQPSASTDQTNPGTIEVRNVSSGTIRLVVDVQGWFAPYYGPTPGSANPGGPGRRSFSHFTDFSIDDRSELHLNEASGDEWLSDDDVDIAGTGLNLSVGRNYNSRDNGSTGAFGPGWSSDAADVKLVAGTGSPAPQTLDGPTGYQVVFAASGSTYTPPTGLRATLKTGTVNNAAGFILYFRDSGQTWDFTSAGQLYSQTDRDQNRLLFNYDGSGELTSITDTRGHTLTITWTAGRITSITDVAGRTWTYGYTAGQLTSYTDPTGSQTTYGYDSNGYLDSITNGAGAATTMTADTYGRVLTVVQHPTPSTPITSRFAYQNGRTQATDSNTNMTTYLYDSTGRVTDVFDALGNNQSVIYDGNSDVTAYTPATDQATSSAVTNTYDATTGNLKSSTLPTGAVGSATYPTGGSNPDQPTTSTSPQGNTTSYSYGPTNDPMGTTVKNSSGTIVSTQSVIRNGAGQVTSSTDGNGNVTHYAYNAAGELTTITYPAPRQPATFGYDTLGRVTSFTNGDGTVTNYEYDADDRVVHVDDSGADHEVTYTYDGAGNLTQRVDSSGTETTTYDGLNRITAQTLAKGGTTAYTYDGVGNLLTLTDAGGTTTYTYTTTNEVHTIADPAGATTTFKYNGDGNRDQETFADGTQENTTYDASGRIKTIIDTVPGGATVDSETYTYTNPAGTDTVLRQTMTTVTGAKNTYSYDGLDELTGDVVTLAGGTTHTYAESYDPAGNRLTSTADGTTTSQAYNADDELCWATTAAVTSTSCSNVPTGAHSSFTYDGSGNLTQVTHADTSTTGYGYNGYGQLTTEGPLTFSYGGTSQNERYTSTDSSTGGQANLFTQSILGLTTVADQTSGTTTAYTRSPTGQLVAADTGSGTDLDYLTDATGSIVGTVNSTNGTVTQAYSYDPTGNLLSGNTGDPNPFRYTGQYQDQSTGTYASGARTLNTTYGVWTAPDPSGQDANPYAYAGDDPINNTDPTGLFSVDDALGAVADVSGVVASVADFIPGGQEVGAAATAVSLVADGVKTGYDCLGYGSDSCSGDLESDAVSATTFGVGRAGAYADADPISKGADVAGNANDAATTAGVYG